MIDEVGKYRIKTPAEIRVGKHLAKLFGGDKMKEVKMVARCMITCSHYNNLDDKTFDRYIREICQLFPKTPDNPDGYEPEPVNLEEFFGLHHAELDAIMMDVLRQVASILSQPLREEPKRDELNPMPNVKAKRGRTYKMVEPDEGRLLTDEKIEQLFLLYYTKQYGEEAAKQLLKQLPDCNYAKAIAQEQRDLTASIKDAECQAKLDKALLMQEGYMEQACQARVERTLNLFERSRALDGSMWWRVMPEKDWQALKKKEGVK